MRTKHFNYVSPLLAKNCSKWSQSQLEQYLSLLYDIDATIDKVGFQVSLPVPDSNVNPESGAVQPRKRRSYLKPKNQNNENENNKKERQKR
jgi:hypothetical protein